MIEFASHVSHLQASITLHLPSNDFDGHTESLMCYFESITDELATKNILLNRHFGRLIVLGHDAGYHEDHKSLGYEFKEPFSADITTNVLVEMGMV